MRIRKLPPALVKRLQNAVAREVQKKRHHYRAYRVLGKMKNADHRRHMALVEHNDIAKKNNTRRVKPSNTQKYGFRVREMDVSRNFPRGKVIIKRVPEQPPAKPFPNSNAYAQIQRKPS